jgi:phosphatidate phosphatase APP1
MARTVFLHNSRTRLPFEGVAAFYQALQQGTASGFNPVFYLSKSAWNLFDLLIDFFEVRHIPLGPLFLSDLGFSPDKLFWPPTIEYKLGVIQTLLDAYPDWPFILIGDSGEKDPQVYVQAAESNPDRILAIYIRDVTGPRRDADLKALAERAQQAGTEMLLVEDTGAAAAHALQKGWILPEAYPQVLEERAEDQRPAAPFEELLNPGGDT